VTPRLRNATADVWGKSCVVALLGLEAAAASSGADAAGQQQDCDDDQDDQEHGHLPTLSRGDSSIC
jgi:hypothetical protein